MALGFSLVVGASAAINRSAHASAWSKPSGWNYQRSDQGSVLTEYRPIERAPITGRHRRLPRIGDAGISGDARRDERAHPS